MMSRTAPVDPAALAASITDWWALSGLDIAVQDSPRNWLGTARPAVVPATSVAEAPVHAPAPTAPIAPIPTVSAPMPDDLDAFMTWLADDPSQPEAGFSTARILPQILVRPDLLVITDMPGQDDIAAGRLFSGADGALLTGMLRALGIAAGQTALASLLLARPTGGIIDDTLAERAASRLHHWMRLIRPNAIILLGDKTSRAFAKTNGEADSLPTRTINLDDGTIAALSLPAPFVLLKHPERKAAAWVHLRHMAKR